MIRHPPRSTLFPSPTLSRPPHGECSPPLSAPPPDKVWCLSVGNGSNSRRSPNPFPESNQNRTASCKLLPLASLQNKEYLDSSGPRLRGFVRIEWCLRGVWKRCSARDSPKY